MADIEVEVVINGSKERAFDVVTIAGLWPQWAVLARAVAGVTERPFQLRVPFLEDPAGEGRQVPPGSGEPATPARAAAVPQPRPSGNCCSRAPGVARRQACAGGNRDRAHLPTPAEPRVTLRNMEKAGFWIRLRAYVVDIAILFIVDGVIFEVLQRNGLEGWWLLVDLILGASYFSVLWSHASPLGAGRTVGSQQCGLKVIRTDGADLTLMQGLIRWAALLVSFLVLFIGVIWVAFDANKQGWHDKIAGTYVISVSTDVPV